MDAANVPGTASVKKVMVYIHGGGYTAGDAALTIPTDLVADYDVIVVTIHYRLGFFGFLSSGDAAAPGNNGLRDQVMALQWVKDNIREFGGDPSDVTVLGESAGATSVSFLSLSPYTRGLFTKAVMQSGTAVAPWASLSPTKARNYMYRLASRLDCLPWWSLASPVDYHNKIISCLRNKPAFSIESFEDNLPGNGEIFSDLLNGIKSTPVVDGDFIPGDPKILLGDIDYLQRNGIADRSYIAGTTNDEGAANFLGLESSVYLTDAGMRSLAKYASKFHYPISTNDEMIDLVDFLYSYPRQSDGRPPFQAMKDVHTDILFVFPTIDFLNRLTRTSPTTPAYHYLFDHYPELVDRSLPAIASSHAWDLLYQFDQVNGTKGDYFLPKPDISTADSRAMADVFRGVLTQFAKTGNPSRGSTGGSPASWPRYDPVGRKYMNLSPRPEARSRLYAKRMSLWDDFLPGLASSIFGWY